MAGARQLVEQGSVREAAHFLGYAPFLQGMVVEGNRIGRTLGYPTANLKPAVIAQPTPAQGVYVAWVKVRGQWHQSMVNIGIRPTLDLENVTIEAHLFDFDEDVYGEQIAIHFLDRIRDEMRFPSLAALKEQLRNDRIRSLEMLRQMNWKPSEEDDRVFPERE